MNENLLEKTYIENLEERIIDNIAKECDLSYEKSMDIYYKSKLADRIYNGSFDIQYLDYKVLTQILMDSEKELFEEK